MRVTGARRCLSRCASSISKARLLKMISFSALSRYFIDAARFILIFAADISGFRPPASPRRLLSRALPEAARHSHNDFRRIHATISSSRRSKRRRARRGDVFARRRRRRNIFRGAPCAGTTAAAAPSQPPLPDDDISRLGFQALPCALYQRPAHVGRLLPDEDGRYYDTTGATCHSPHSATYHAARISC